MDHRIYLVIYNHPEQGFLGIHADASSEKASEFAWKLMQDEALFARDVVDNGVVDEPEHGMRQICLGLEVDAQKRRTLIELDDCPHPGWHPIDPIDFADLSRGETPHSIKRWLAFEAWAE